MWVRLVNLPPLAEYFIPQDETIPTYVMSCWLSHSDWHTHTHTEQHHTFAKYSLFIWIWTGIMGIALSISLWAAQFQRREAGLGRQIPPLRFASTSIWPISSSNVSQPDPPECERGAAVWAALTWMMMVWNRALFGSCWRRGFCLSGMSISEFAVYLERCYRLAHLSLWLGIWSIFFLFFVINADFIEEWCSGSFGETSGLGLCWRSSLSWTYDEEYFGLNVLIIFFYSYNFHLSS